MPSNTPCPDSIISHRSQPLPGASQQPAIPCPRRPLQIETVPHPSQRPYGPAVCPIRPTDAMVPPSVQSPPPGPSGYLSVYIASLPPSRAEQSDHRSLIQSQSCRQPAWCAWTGKTVRVGFCHAFLTVLAFLPTSSVWAWVPQNHYLVLIQPIRVSIVPYGWALSGRREPQISSLARVLTIDGGVGRRGSDTGRPATIVPPRETATGAPRVRPGCH